MWIMHLPLLLVNKQLHNCHLLQSSPNDKEASQLPLLSSPTPKVKEASQLPSPTETEAPKDKEASPI
jgi:hypothetical protein